MGHVVVLNEEVPENLVNHVEVVNRVKPENLVNLVKPVNCVDPIEIVNYNAKFRVQMSGLPKDIVNIVFCFIYTSFIERCNYQYHVLFRSSSQGDYIVHKRSGLILNDRPATNYDEYKYIYNIHTRKRIREMTDGVKHYIKVSKNYII